MAEIDKVLIDDNDRVRQMFATFRRQPNDLDLAMAICGELTMHANIEEEIVYPALAEIDEGLAEESQAEHDDAKELIAEIEAFEEPEPRLRLLMTALEESVRHHMAEEEREVFPILNGPLLGDAVDMGRRAFNLRQEALGSDDRPKALPSRSGMANLGW